MFFFFGVFDAVHVGGLPTIHPRTHFVVRLKANGDDTGQHKLTFRWLSPFDEELWSSTGEMSVAPSPNPAFEVDLPIIAVVDLPLNVTGQYTMQVTLDGELTASARLLVNANQPTMVSGTPNGCPKELARDRNRFNRRSVYSLRSRDHLRRSRRAKRECTTRVPPKRSRRE